MSATLVCGYQPDIDSVRCCPRPLFLVTSAAPASGDVSLAILFGSVMTKSPAVSAKRAPLDEPLDEIGARWAAPNSAADSLSGNGAPISEAEQRAFAVAFFRFRLRPEMGALAAAPQRAQQHIYCHTCYRRFLAIRR